MAAPQIQTARQKLGEAISFRLREQRRTDRELADRCGCSAADVEKFRLGTLVPEPRVWRRMCEMGAKTLYQLGQLHKDALAEQEAERELALRSIQRGAPRVGTNLGDKIASATTPATPDQPAAVVETPPEPEPDQDPEPRADRRTMPPRPPGSMSTQQVELRRDYTRKALRVRPHRKSEGPDGIVTEVREVFGVGISPAEVEAIRREVVREMARNREIVEQHAQRAEISADNTAPAIVTAPDDRGPRQIAVAPAPSDAEIGAAIAIVVDTVPALRRMVIERDPSTGVVSWTYEVHTVHTGGGSLQVKR